MHDAALELSSAPALLRAVLLTADGAVTASAAGTQLRIGLQAIELPDRAVAIAAVEQSFWIVSERERTCTLHRLDVGAAAVGAATTLGDLGSGIAITTCRGAAVALIEGERGVLAELHGDTMRIDELGVHARERRLLVAPRALAIADAGAVVVPRALGGARCELPADLARGVIVSGTLLLDGAALLFVIEHNGSRTAVVYGARRGDLRSRIRIGDARIVAVAERAACLVLARDTHVALFDIRAGRALGERILPAPLAAAAISADAARLVVCDDHGTTHQLDASMRNRAGAPAPDQTLEPDPDHDGERAATSQSACEPTHASPPSEPPVRATSTATPALPSVTLHALRPAASPPALSGSSRAAYLADVRAWSGALCRTALHVEDERRRQTAGEHASASVGELEAILAHSATTSEALSRARELEREAIARLERSSGRGAPHVELAVELGLDATASTILLLAAGPQIWGELARAYGIVSGEAHRTLVDEHLLARLLEADLATRADIARALDPDAPLIRTGAVELGRGQRPHAPLVVHPAIARRLAGEAAPRDGRPSPPPIVLEDFIGPRPAIAALMQRLAVATPEPPRVVIRGRPASGRRTLAVSLAAQAHRRVAVVEIGAGADLALALERALRDVALRGEVPLLSLDGAPDDPALAPSIRAVLDRHVGPLFVRAPLTGAVPLAPGYDLIDLAPLSETERHLCWTRALAAHGHEVEYADALAATFATGAGAIVHACAAVDPARTDVLDGIRAVLRSRRSARIGAIARRVDHLADWSDLVVADEIADALTEIVGRVSPRRTVLEAWGMERCVTTAQGITALFQGGPGTGKTMAAGVIARALGYELWRVDLSKLVSKWIGETEKNLDAVFEAAEDGEIVLLFDEADSLFGKRTAVTSSHDRNANLETNFLLQRLDAFTGLAVLTTNLGTAIDPAFRRRLSVQVQFPFPDEGERVRLWRAHLPASLPGVEALDIEELARRYPIAGGYIRNAALRAAFLAARDGGPLTTPHLHRSIALEYQRMGRLGDGRLD